MEKTQLSIGYVGGIILNIMIFFLLIIIYAYIYKLENIGCECASHSNKEFIKSYTIISIVFLLLTSFVSIKDINDNFGETIAVLFSVITVVFYIIFVIYIYLTFEYVRYLINEKCKCSEGISRDIIMIGTMIELILFVVALFTIIIIPVLVESISSIFAKLPAFQNDVKESIHNPFSSIKKTPKKLTKSAKDVTNFFKKSVKDLKKFGKQASISKASKRR
jgi:hypothetical protein